MRVIKGVLVISKDMHHICIQPLSSFYGQLLCKLNSYQHSLYIVLLLNFRLGYFFIEVQRQFLYKKCFISHANICAMYGHILFTPIIGIKIILFVCKLSGRESNEMVDKAKNPVTNYRCSTIQYVYIMTKNAQRIS